MNRLRRFLNSRLIPHARRLSRPQNQWVQFLTLHLSSSRRNNIEICLDSIALSIARYVAAT